MAMSAIAMFWTQVLIAAATTAATIQAQQENAKKQAEYQKQIQDQTTENAKQAQIDQTKQLNLQLVQEQAQSSQEAENIQKDKIKAVGRATVATGEAGVSGISVDNLLGDFNRQESTYIDSLKYNTEIARENFNIDAKGINSRTANRINGARGSIVKRPNMYAAALGIGGKTLDAGTQYMNWGNG